MLPDLAPFFDLRRHLRIAHHVPGRIRLKLDMAALKHLPKVDPAPFQELFRRIRGVQATRINAPALSVVVDYDTSVIAMSVWQRLLAGDQAEVEAILGRNIG